MEYDAIPPYYVDGPDSPQVNLLTAIPLLCQYCTCLPGDKYTVHTPNWFVEYSSSNHQVRVVIELPAVSGILQPILGPFTTSKKLAKRAAALETCKMLHQKGELDDKLLPRRCNVIKNDFDHYFTHCPNKNTLGDTNKERTHDIKIPHICKGLIIPYQTIYLHIIELQPLFDNRGKLEIIQNLYESNLCYGFLSQRPLPKLCQFPVYVAAGEVSVHLNLNYKLITLTEKEISLLKGFHYLIFKDVLKVVKSFLILHNDGFLVVPIVKKSSQFEIDFETAIKHQELIHEKSAPDDSIQSSLEVTKENYGGTIVTPWYRKDNQQYVVIKVCDDLNVLSSFPSKEFVTYADYFYKKHKKTVINKTQPLLLVKGISKRLNYIKPHGKKKEEMENFEHLISELCVKQELPGALWLQAILLPTIFNRIISLLQADELRVIISQGIGLGMCELPKKENWAPLILDKYVVNDNVKGKVYVEDIATSQEVAVKNDCKRPLQELSQLVAAKKLDLQYPWNELDEPIDIERNRNVTLLDIIRFDNFVSNQVSLDYRLQNHSNSQTISNNQGYLYKQIQSLNRHESSNGPELVDIFTALCTAKSNDIVNLERLETLGDSFLKISISLFLILKYPTFDEGMLTSLKGKLISNENLFCIGNKKGISGYIKASEFDPYNQWKPPKFNVPKSLRDRIRISISPYSLFHFNFTKTEQIDGILSNESHDKIIATHDVSEDENLKYNSIDSYLDKQAVRDKSVADCVEALLGVYFRVHGFKGGLRFLKWLEIVPHYQNIDRLFEMKLPNPLFTKNTICDRSIEYHIPTWEKVEAKLHYNFKNRAYLLQALTHASYSSNRITNCYQTLEFLGDAVLDFLITCHIFESSKNLSPGDLTDLRSALVNNITFACFTVRFGFQKHLLYSSNQLSKYIQTFVRYQELNDHQVNEEVLTLISEGDVHMGEHIDVPKVLGDVFEALIGAVFLDSGMCLETVWEVVHHLIWKEIELFMANVPKNPIRMIYEAVDTHPEFGSAVYIDDGHVMVKLEILLHGSRKAVYGIGDNKASAKKAAAKIALRLLSK